jgi:NAD(P)-dependent dehydrogenase (short-subunit alcohol dehydrogenase family)
MARFAGRIVVVTGAASGIGLAASERFLAEGATVYMVDRNAEGLARAQAALDGGARCNTVVLDVTDERGWAALAAVIQREAGKLDVLFNNAGFGAFRSIADTSLEEWRAVMAVNLDSVFLGTKAMLPLLAASGRGAIVNMSSIRGIAAAANTSSYCAAKGGVRLFTKAAALECAALGNGVRVNSIHPGHVLTPLSAAHYDDPHMAAKLLADIPLGRPAAASEIAEAVLFLASDEARYMTGAELVIDGGSTAQ